MNEVKIFEALSSKHLHAVRRLFHEYYEIRSFDKALGDYKQELQDLPGSYGRPGGCLLLACKNDVPMGCVAYRRIDQNICEMKRLFVRQEARGNGVGKKLVSKLIEEANKRGYKRMLLDTHPWMESARHLYVNAGFTEVSPYNQNPTPGIRFFELNLNQVAL